MTVHALVSKTGLPSKPTADQIAKGRAKQHKNVKTIDIPVAKKPASKTKPAASPKPKAKEQLATLQSDQGGVICGTARTSGEITWATINQFIAMYAGGQTQNVRVEALPNVALDTDRPVPFFRDQTYTDKGTRYHDLMDHLQGVNGDNRLSTILQACAKRGTSRKKNIMTWMLLNGGQSRSSASWGTSFIRLVVAK
tara:strand:- start:518 stop:1105 length:588 start_codon:yes stop_codon:yes gene_type:complete